MEEIVGVFFKMTFNFLGACIRWFFGSIQRIVLKKRRYTFKEYLLGPEELLDIDDDYDVSKNIIVGGVFFFCISIIMIKIFI